MEVISFGNTRSNIIPAQAVEFWYNCDMTLRLRTAFFIVIIIATIWFLYIERSILAPFVLAAIFAYVFNPVVNFISRHTNLPRAISIIIVYLMIVLVFVYLGIFLVEQVINESSQLKNFISSIVLATKDQYDVLPSWVNPIAQDILISLEKLNIFSTSSIFKFFPQALSRVLSFFIFAFSAFYFLKEGRAMTSRFIRIIPNSYRGYTELILRKINDVFSRYLRGQLLLVFLVSSILFASLSILGVKFALILAIFSGFAEIVPFIGPIVATIIAALVVLIDGRVNFGLSQLQGAIAVIIIYFLVRQIQDYFVTPHVMGKIVRLHPLVILFAVLAGEHLLGILGVLLAVPVAATIRILLEFSLEKINRQK